MKTTALLVPVQIDREKLRSGPVPESTPGEKLLFVDEAGVMAPFVVHHAPESNGWYALGGGHFRAGGEHGFLWVPLLVALETPGTAYQRGTHEVATYPNAGQGDEPAVNYCVIGLVGEAGEVANHWKKIVRGDYPDYDPKTKNHVNNRLHAELGDCLWYIARLAEETGTTIDALMAHNTAKLIDRKKRGVIQGNGDER